MTDPEKLDAAIRAALGLPEGLDLAGIEYGKTEQWDSVAHVELVAAIEGTFGIVLGTEDVISMSSYPAVRTILQKYIDVADERNSGRA